MSHTLTYCMLHHCWDNVDTHCSKYSSRSLPINKLVQHSQTVSHDTLKKQRSLRTSALPFYGPFISRQCEWVETRLSQRKRTTADTVEERVLTRSTTCENVRYCWPICQSEDSYITKYSEKSYLVPFCAFVIKAFPKVFTFLYWQGPPALLKL